MERDERFEVDFMVETTRDDNGKARALDEAKKGNKTQATNKSKELGEDYPLINASSMDLTAGIVLLGTQRLGQAPSLKQCCNSQRQPMDNALRHISNSLLARTTPMKPALEHKENGPKQRSKNNLKENRGPITRVLKPNAVTTKII